MPQREHHRRHRQECRAGVQRYRRRLQVHPVEHVVEIVKRRQNDAIATRHTRRGGVIGIKPVPRGGAKRQED